MAARGADQPSKLSSASASAKGDRPASRSRKSPREDQSKVESPIPSGFDNAGAAGDAPASESALHLEQAAREVRERYPDDARLEAGGYVGDAADEEALDRAARDHEERNRGEPEKPPPDPIAAANARSLELRSILNYRYPGGHGYCTDGLAALLRRAADLYAVEADSRYLVRMEDLALLLCDAEPSDPVLFTWQQMIKSYLPSGGAGSSTAPPLANAQQLIDEGKVVLRWDVVEVLANAATDRDPGTSLDTEHFLIATLRSRAGQGALAKAGALNGGIEPLTRAAADLLRQPNLPHALSPAKREVIATDLPLQQMLVSLEDEVGASFDPDRPRRLALDSLGVREDAAALSSLILLRAATPPLAIGLFGAWGSGKSTLMCELQHRIHEDLTQERRLRSQGAADRNPDTQRITNVVQIEFNAWAYADSQNLWASLASEIFDQLAAGGLRFDGETRLERRYESLVNEVKLRSSRDAAAVRVSNHEIATLRQRIGIAEESLSAAIRGQSTAASEAAARTAYELVAPEPGKKSGTVYMRFGEPPKQKDRDAAAVVRDALGEGQSLDDRLKIYAEQSSEVIRFGRIVFDFARARPWAFVAFAILLAGILLLIASFVAKTPQTVAVFSAAWVSLAALIGGGLGWLLKIIWPALRFAAAFNRNVRERRAAARAAEVEARDALDKLTTELGRVEANRNASEAWIKKFGVVADGANAASPAIMLEYLMSGSADVETLRGQLGVVATVRRCFEQLDAVLQRMRTEREGEAIVDRIILYIDDLDRCTPDQVSQVLQAVHLLLAFECFVVVVAVDARWLKQSLETSQAQLKAVQSADPKVPGEQVATAADYLEKIFQIAFWVRPLVDQDADGPARYEAYRNLVRGIASPARAAAAAQQQNAAEQGAPSDRAGVSFTWTEPTRLEQADAPRRKGLQLTEPEVEFMEAMGPLAAKSPRSVKRMVNLYRLMRVRYRGDQLRLFLSAGAPGVPSYRELLFALALEIGLSPMSRQKLRAYVTRPAGADWTPAKLEPQLLDAERPLLKAVLPALTDVQFNGLFTAVEEVRRFSFLA